MSRFWTTEEDAYLRQHYNVLTGKQIALQLNRTKCSVYQRANGLGLNEEKVKRPGIVAYLEEKHALGWSDAEIAEAYTAEHPDTPIHRKAVQERRHRLSLPSNAYSEHRRRRVAERTQQQLQAAGLTSIGDLRAVAFRKFQNRAGWPVNAFGELRPRHVQILNFLYEQGPHTRRQIAEAIDMPWKGSRKSLASNDPEGSYLAHLQAKGLVVRLGRRVQMGGQGKNVSQYGIPPSVQRMSHVTEKPQSQHSGHRRRVNARGADVPVEAAHGSV
jgi:hypothetical protein